MQSVCRPSRFCLGEGRICAGRSGRDFAATSNILAIPGGGSGPSLIIFSRTCLDRSARLAFDGDVVWSGGPGFDPEPSGED